MFARTLRLSQKPEAEINSLAVELA